VNREADVKKSCPSQDQVRLIDLAREKGA